MTAGGGDDDAPDDQARTPYLDALLAYSARGPARLHVPGHKGESGADPALGRRARPGGAPARHPGADPRNRRRRAPTPFARAQELAAAAWGARRAWFLINGASQGSLAAGLTLAQLATRR